MSVCIGVIEDEPELLELLRILLESSGFSVAAVDHPDGVHEMMQSMHPDLFVVDLMLPGTNGIDLARQLRASGGADTPMIALSASKLMLEVANASNLFQATMSKPFDVFTLLEYVQQYTRDRAAPVP